MYSATSIVLLTGSGCLFCAVQRGLVFWRINMRNIWVGPLGRVDRWQRWLGSWPLLIFYGHQGPSFMAITSGFIGNLAAVTFGPPMYKSKPDSLSPVHIIYTCVLCRCWFLGILHGRGAKIRWIYSSMLQNYFWCSTSTAVYHFWQCKFSAYWGWKMENKVYIFQNFIQYESVFVIVWYIHLLCSINCQLGYLEPNRNT